MSSIANLIKYHDEPVQIRIGRGTTKQGNKTLTGILKLHNYYVVKPKNFSLQKYFFQGLIIHPKIVLDAEEEFDEELDVADDIFALTDVGCGASIGFSLPGQTPAEFIKGVKETLLDLAEDKGETIADALENWQLQNLAFEDDDTADDNPDYSDGE